jgi:ribulose-bisphosphate carboxylase large chain
MLPMNDRVPDESAASDRLQARYWIETAFPLADAAAMMAGEQSTGTFVRVPGETDELRERYAARVERIEELGTVDAPSLPGSGLPKGHAGPVVRRTAEVTLSWPLANMGTSLPNLMATVAGNLFELKPFSGLKLLDVTLPPAFLRAYQGPQFGVEGTRRLTGVYGRPVIGTIIKPSVGMTPEQTAAQVRMLAEAGADFIKDDELQADGPHCPFEQRMAAVLRELNAYADKTGRRPMYAANITGEIDEMLRRHDQVAVAGGTCVMVSINSVGLPAMTVLRRHSQVAIHGHRNGWGMYRSCAREWIAQQVLRDRCFRDCLGARVPDADVSRAVQGMRDHAGFFFRPIRKTGSGHLQGSGVDGSDLRLRRRHSCASGGACGGREESPSGMGGSGEWYSAG